MTLVDELAPAARQGEWLGAFGLLSQLAQVPGPALAVTAVRAGALGWVVVGLAFLGVGPAGPRSPGAGSGRDAG